MLCGPSRSRKSAAWPSRGSKTCAIPTADLVLSRGATDASARNFLIFHLGDRAKVVLRPSGTEPKAKVYLEVCTPPCPAGTSTANWEQQCREVDAQLKTITDDFLTKSLGLIGMTPDAGMK